MMSPFLCRASPEYSTTVRAGIGFVAVDFDPINSDGMSPFLGVELAREYLLEIDKALRARSVTLQADDGNLGFVSAAVQADCVDAKKVILVYQSRRGHKGGRRAAKELWYSRNALSRDADIFAYRQSVTPS